MEKKMVAFIPVRGGSKSIPLKNIKIFNGKPLVFWTINAACECRFIDEVFVATDSERIKNAVESFRSSVTNGKKIRIIDRGSETATDTASTESAMLEFAQTYFFDDVVLIQATSPLLTCADLEGGVNLYYEPGTDGVLSAVRQKRFIWNVDQQGNAYPTNYDFYNRPRRQEFNGYLVENGAFYITSRDRLIKYKNRMSGNIRAFEMPEDTFFEIDEPSDWIVMEILMQNRMRRQSTNEGDAKCVKIKMFLTDCDGCLTDGGMYYSENGDELKKFNTRDGMAFGLLKKAGIITGIITGENRELNARRAQKLGVDIIRQGCTDKTKEVMDICREYNIDLQEILYVGDDINDIQLLKSVGISCCPNDANSDVRNSVQRVSPVEGGRGVIREITDWLLHCQDA